MTVIRPSRPRFFIPEVIQTSAMDCGPAVLASLVAGFGGRISYGRLREACHTDVDGTSIDTLETVAGQLGLDAEQIMVPVDHLLLPEAETLPAILVVRHASGLTHFILVWRRHGPLLQVMDPAAGRRWMTCGQLLEEVHVHTHLIEAAQWHDWARTEGFQNPLRRRLRNLRLGRDADRLIEEAGASTDWRTLAQLDAATRLVEALAGARGVRRGREARAVLHAFREREVPELYWSVRPAPPSLEGTEQVHIRGAVLVRVRGSRPAAREGDDHEAAPLSPELAAALEEPDHRPGRELLRLLRGAGVVSGLVLAVALVLAACSVVLEGLLLRGVLDVGRDLKLVEQRLGAAGFFLGFAGILLAIELGIADRLARLGRRLEVRLRMAFLDKLPRLNDRYFQSRPVSDMAERSHMIQQVRLLPRLAGQFVRAVLTLAATALAVAWVDPAGAPLALAAAGLAIVLPVALLPFLQGLDLRVRTHAGALSRFYLDALLGLTTVRAHGAERAVRREHESLLVEWARASLHLLRWAVAIEGLQLILGFGLAGALLLGHANRAGDAAAVLLLAYWVLNIPVLGEEIALLTRQYPLHRNVTLRLLEPLGAPEAEPAPAAIAPRPPALPEMGVSIHLDDVTVLAGGQTILHDVSLEVPAGSHLAIVGASGAGKSSLVGLLLGWHRAATGTVRVDGQSLDAARLEWLRGQTAWVDPAVQLWNRSLAGNLLYGLPPGALPAFGMVLHEAELYEVLQRLPDGLQTALGEGGGLLSGGEGQRVRLGRAMMRAQARLVILDEPFRGLDRARRHALLARVRQVWRDATLLCITHDVGDTQEFERVLTIDGGTILEDGTPAQLAADPASRYRALLEAEHAVRAGLWASPVWRRLRLESGRLQTGGEGKP